MSLWERLLLRDELTYVLAATLVSAVAYSLWAAPSSAVHPILLGRQSDVGRVRNPKESAVYRNYGTGSMPMLPVRPAKEIRVLTDFIKPSEDPRHLWDSKISNDQLKERYQNLAAGFVHKAGLDRESNVLILLNDGIEWLITDLALASIGVPSFTLTALNLLVPVLDHHPPTCIILHASFVHQLLEVISEANEFLHHTLILVGEDQRAFSLLSEHTATGLKAMHWSDLENTGKLGLKHDVPLPSESDVLTVSFYDVNEKGIPMGVQFSHENIIAGVTSTRVLTPPNQLLTSADTVYSSHTLASGFGRSIAYAALWDGANFTTLQSTFLVAPRNLPVPRDLSDLFGAANSKHHRAPTVLFLHASHIEAISSEVIRNAKSKVIFDFALRHKLAHMYNGSITRDGFWDKALFNSSRREALGRIDKQLRTVVVTEPLGHEDAIPARIALSLPFIRCYTHHLVSGPVLASHPLDMQIFPVPHGGSSAHVGPPAINVEVKLSNVNDSVIEAGGDPEGELNVRGPSVGRPIETVEQEVDLKEIWTPLNRNSVIKANGTFMLLG